MNSCQQNPYLTRQPHLLTNSYLLCHVALVVTQLLKQRSFTNLVMAQPTTCLGHQEREMRRNKIDKLATTSMETLDKNYRVLIKNGPVSVETSLKELEEDYESKPEWKLIKEGGVLSVPVEELRMENFPKPNQSGCTPFHLKI